MALNETKVNDTIDKEENPNSRLLGPELFTNLLFCLPILAILEV